MNIRERLANPFVIIHTGIMLGMIVFAATLCEKIQGYRPERLVLQNDLRSARVSLENKNLKRGGF
ncbi:MAG: hypothetical protein ABIM74_00865 [candidate division WOR-3 bacterium]